MSPYFEYGDTSTVQTMSNAVTPNGAYVLNGKGDCVTASLLLKIALAGWKVEVVTLVETFQHRLDIGGELQRLN